MATENDNDASVKLFIGKLGYRILRTPTILVHPVFQHARGIPSHIRLTKLSVNDSAILYRSVMLTRDFFPKDIDKVLASRLYAGTWIATLKADEPSGLRKLRGGEGISIRSAYDGNAQRLMDGVFKSWAVLSIWKCDEIFKLQVKGASLIVRSLAAMSRYMDRTLPWFEIPSFPNIFNSFGMQFLFGLHAEGDKSHELITALFWHAHNLAQQQKSQVIMSELGPSDPLIKTIPHWKVFSSADDLWCIKHLLDPPIKDAASLSTVSAAANSTSETVVDRVEHIEWSDSSPDSTIFVDPRDV
ncbi:hypothetical protein O6H91_16G004600 [Diphasiastrum complanatum]|nr:hypothetical protein O6H91_16G004600 [Diphasiastrum complanatum]